jgi:hypothetical protein
MKRTRKKVGQYKPKDDIVNKFIHTYGLCASIIFPKQADLFETKQADLFEPKASKKNEMWSKNDIKPYYLHYKKKYIKQYGKLTHYHERCISNAVKRHIPKYFCRVCNEYSDYRIYKYDNIHIDCKTCTTKRTNQYCKKKYKEDSLFRFVTNARQLIYLSLRNQGYKKGSKSSKILGCEWDFFKDYIERRFQSGMSWDNYGKWHLDHIYPISKATSYEMALELNHYTNFQPLWAFDNISKNNKVVEHQRKLAL